MYYFQFRGSKYKTYNMTIYKMTGAPNKKLRFYQSTIRFSTCHIAIKSRECHVKSDVLGKLPTLLRELDGQSLPDYRNPSKRKRLKKKIKFENYDFLKKIHY